MNDCRYTDLTLIVKYLKAKHEQHTKHELWERHVANSLWKIAQSISNDKNFKSYEEILNEIKPKKETDKRTAKEIYEDTMGMFKRE